MLHLLSQTTQHAGSWSDPQDVKEFLIWVFGPTGVITGIIALLIAWRSLKTGSAAQTTASRAEGKIDATTPQIAANAQAVNDINRSLPPKQ